MAEEANVKDKIKRWLVSKYPTAFWFMYVSTGYGKHGIPDFIACVPKVITQDMVGTTVGLFVGIEAKAKTGRLSKQQVVRLEEITDAAGIVEVVCGVDDKYQRSIESLERALG